jgi:flagellar export protein FliJ
MAFSFPLASVLRFRKSLERNQELRLVAANHDVARVAQQIADVDACRAALLKREAQQLQSETTGAELQFETLCRETLKQYRAQLEAEQRRLEKVRDGCRKAHQEARKAREVLEILREQQLAVYRQNELRQDQRQLDDLFLMRRLPRR